MIFNDEFTALVAAMRQAQVRYFRTSALGDKRKHMRASKELEARVDAAIRARAIPGPVAELPLGREETMP